MTREEAIAIIKAIGKHAIETHLTDPGDIVDATVMAVKALVPKPDEVTGLMPCGCGGKAVCEPYWFPERDDDEWHCLCSECGVMTMRTETSEGAREEWNTAMGWKGGAE